MPALERNGGFGAALTRRGNGEPVRTSGPELRA
jgi:hypothetical protein